MTGNTPEVRGLASQTVVRSGTEFGRRRLFGAGAGILAAAASIQLIPSLASTAVAQPLTSSPTTAGSFEDLGTMLATLTLRVGAIGQNSQGDDLLITVPEGDDTGLNVVNLGTRSLESFLPLAGSKGSWGACFASDGTAYIGSHTDGRLYRYDPDTDQLTDLGTPVPGQTYLFGLVAGADGSVFGGTYNGAHVFRWDPATEEFTDYGSLSATEDWARGIAYDGDRNVVYAGLRGGQARLIRLEVDSGATTDITPTGLGDTGVDKVWYTTGIVFLMVAGKLLAYRADDMTPMDFLESGTAVSSPAGIAVGQVSPAQDGHVYVALASGGNYWLKRVELSTLTVTAAMAGGAPVKIIGELGASPIGLGWGTTSGGTPLLYGLAGNYVGTTFAYDPQAQTMQHWVSPLTRAATPIRSMTAGPAGSASSGSVFMSGLVSGAVAVYDRASGEVRSSVDDSTLPRLGQVEGWAWGDGRLYSGVYPYARISQWDPTIAASASNPVVLAELRDSHQQNRPYAVAVTPDWVIVGTGPDYGSTDGALTLIDRASGAVSVHSGIVADQTIGSLAVSGTSVWAGSSIINSNGDPVVAGEAALVRFDLSTMSKVSELIPANDAFAINALSSGPDGHLWGLADGTVFVIDEDSEQIVRSFTVHDLNSGPQEGDAVWHPNGRLYVVSARQLFEIDPLAQTGTVIKGAVGRISLDADGALFVTHRPAGRSGFTNLARYVPVTGAQLPNDLRATVHVGNVDSQVANRFTRIGATLADLVPDDAAWRGHGDFVAEVTRLARDWVATELVTGSEADEIQQAAGRSTVGHPR